MKAKISNKGKILLKNPMATNALIQAILANPEEFLNGNILQFDVAAYNNNSLQTFAVKKVSSINK